MTPGPQGLAREWVPGRPVDVHTTLGVHRRGAGDPTYQASGDGTLWRTARTPAGPGTLCLAERGGVVRAQAWGPGAPWLLDAVPVWLGAGDDPAGFDPRHPLLRAGWARLPGWRVGRTGLVLESLVPTVLEQKVTGGEARRAWRWLVLRHGDPAPGPAPAGMRVAPDAATWARVPSWDWHRAGVGPQRSRTVLRAAGLADRLEQTTALPPLAAARRLQAVPGVGPWTAAEVAQRALGDADAVSVGDLHLPRLVVHALTGRVTDDDDAMLEVLEPYRPHRYRVVRLVELSGVRAPRFGPRLAPQDHRRM